MKKASFITVTLLIFSLSTSSCSAPPIEENNLNIVQNGNDLETEILNLVNEYRTSQGLDPLAFNATVYKYATAHSKSMATEGKISHVNFDIRSSELAVEAHANYVSENVGRNFKTARGLITAWINSPEHRKIMQGHYQYTAVSARSDEDGIIYFTQLFIR